MNDGPASFTRAQSVQGRPVNRTPPRRHMTRSLSRSRSVSPRRLRSRRSPAPRPRPGVASHSRSRSRSPHGNPPQYVSKPAWLVIRDKLSDEDFAFIKDILAYVKGERALLKFAQKCDIPDMPLKWAIRNHVNSFTDAIPYDTIEQVFIVWGLTPTNQLIGKPINCVLDLMLWKCLGHSLVFYLDTPAYPKVIQTPNPVHQETPGPVFQSTPIILHPGMLKYK